MTSQLSAIHVFSYSDLGDVGSTVLHGMLNVIGYIPIFGIFSGASRYDIAIDKLKICAPSNKHFYVVMKVRAIIECCSLGFLLLVPDILISIGIAICQSFSRPINATRIS